ncbi:MAG: nucleotidyltransferase domain-containing protein [Bacteroidota bacterium]
MRLKPEIANDLKQMIGERIPGSSVFLFGSRVDVNARGGDIDLMILSQEVIEKQTLRKIRLEFIKKWGWQKLDLVNFTYSSDSSFRKIIEQSCIPL